MHFSGCTSHQTCITFCAIYWKITINYSLYSFQRQTPLTLESAELIDIPVASLSELVSYIRSHRWRCSRVWPHRCWPDRRLQWYSHWWGSHSCQRQLHNKMEEIWYRELLHQKCISLITSLQGHTRTLTFRFNHIVVPNFQRLWCCLLLVEDKLE